jgi:DNA polymerase I-like protein with 3'-5' exonuclease and polymerase domains
MARYDGGAYAHEILNGDIHTANQKAAGLPERNMAKTFIYGFLYGAGDEKIGKIVHGDATDGKRLKKKFLEHTPAIANLRDAIRNSLVEKEKFGRVLTWKRKYLKGLDGRPLTVRSLHAALNLLLQSAGALICKYWIIRLEERLLELGLEHGEDFQYMAWIHDEVQIACRTHEIAECVVKEAQEAMRDTQAYFNFRVQLDTEGKIGLNWGDCH